jgi:hypothetical protein
MTSSPASIVRGKGAIYAAVDVHGGVVDAGDLSYRDLALATLRCVEVAGGADVRVQAGPVVVHARSVFGRRVVLVAEKSSVAGRDAVRKTARLARVFAATAQPTFAVT